MNDEPLTGSIELPAQLTIHTFDQVLAAVKCRYHSPVDLTFDCRNLQEVDAIGVQLLIATAKSARAGGKKCEFERTTACLIEAVRILGLEEHFEPWSTHCPTAG